MSEEKLNTVREYLAKHFPGQQIEEKHDFDLDARAFKIHVDKGTHLLKVGRLFIDDNSAETITHHGPVEHVRCSRDSRERARARRHGDPKGPATFDRG